MTGRASQHDNKKGPDGMIRPAPSFSGDLSRLGQSLIAVHAAQPRFPH